MAAFVGNTTLSLTNGSTNPDKGTTTGTNTLRSTSISSNSSIHSNASLVYNQSQKGRHYGTVNRSSWRDNGYLMHTISSSDTLQGISLKYEVPISSIQRANQLLGNESIHKYTELKIPYCSNSRQSTPQSSPQTSRKIRNSKSSSSSEQLSASLEEEEVKQKPISPHSLETGEKSIMSLLNEIDKQLVVSRSFANKLAAKSTSLTEPIDAYNRPTLHEQTVQHDTSEHDSLKSKFKRTFTRPTVWNPSEEHKNREKVEDEIFEL